MKLVSFSNNGQESFGILGNSGLHPVLKNFKKDFPDLKAVFGSQKSESLEAFCEENPIPLSTLIWGGTKMRVAYELVPYYAPMIGAGITARLKAVQVIELVEGKDSNLFKEEDGYETATPEPDVISNEKTTVQESKDF